MKSNIINLTNPRFPIGELVTTIGAHQTLGDFDAQNALARHIQGDWGDLCSEDQLSNDLALERGGRLLSVYKTENDTKFWIITEADRSVTTILLPSEY